MIKIISFNLDLTSGAAGMIDGIEAHAGDIVRGVLNSVRRDIVQQANALNTSRADYKNALSPVRIKRGGGMITGTLELNGELAMMIEDGADPFDMHQTILSKGNVKVSKTGNRYKVVPFTHVSPGGRGRTPMGKQFNVPMDVHALGKKVFSYAKDIGSKPGQAKEMPGGLFPKIHPNSRKVGQFQAAGNTYDPFKGMRREPKASGKGSDLKTFRTISDAVENKWYHPGIKAHSFFDKAEARVEDAFNTAIKAYADNMVKGLK